jgi:predicted nucleic acid-binding protein
VSPVKPDKWRVLFDLNIVLDVLIKREPHYPNSARLWSLSENGQIEGILAGHSFTTLFYLYRKQQDTKKAYWAIRKLLQVFSVAPLDGQIIEQACNLAWGDFEDAVQAAAASQSGCHYLVTRDPKGYGPQPITVMRPAELLAVWAASQDQAS